MNIKEILREELNKFDSPNKNIVYAYHGSRSSGEKKPHDGMFFALDKWYAESIGGSFLHKAELTINNPLYLDKYNKILIKNGINGSYAQPPLTISNFNIKEKWNWYLDALWNKGLQSTAEEFEKEIETCDSIYGQDAGNKDTRVWYIKHTNQIKFIN